MNFVWYINLPYHNENVKIFSMHIFTADMANRRDRSTPLF